MKKRLVMLLLGLAPHALLAHHPQEIENLMGFGMQFSSSTSIISGFLHPIIALDHLYFLLGLVFLRIFLFPRYPLFSLFIGATAIGTALQGWVHIADGLRIIFFSGLTLFLFLLFISYLSSKRRGIHFVKWRPMGRQPRNSAEFFATAILIFAGFTFGRFFGDSMSAFSPWQSSMYVASVIASQSFVLVFGSLCMRFLIELGRRRFKEEIFLLSSLFLLSMAFFLSVTYSFSRLA